MHALSSQYPERTQSGCAVYAAPCQQPAAHTFVAHESDAAKGAAAQHGNVLQVVDGEGLQWEEGHAVSLSLT